MRHRTMLAATALMALVGTGAPALAHAGGHDHDRGRFHQRFERSRFDRDDWRAGHTFRSRYWTPRRDFDGRFYRGGFAYGGRSCDRPGFRRGWW